MGTGKQLEAPSKKLAIFGGLLKGISSAYNEEKKKAAEQNRMTAEAFYKMFPQIKKMEQELSMFKSKEARGTREFESKQAQELKVLGLGLESEAADRKQKWDIFKEEIGVAMKKLDIDLTTAREGFASAENIAEFRANADQIAIGLRAQADQILATVKAELDAIESGKQRTFLTTERVAGETFTAGESQLDRQQELTLRGSQEQKDALAIYSSLAKQLGEIQLIVAANPENETMLSVVQTIISSMDDQIEILGPGVVGTPPTIELVKKGGFLGIGQKTVPSFVPRTETPKPSAPVLQSRGTAFNAKVKLMRDNNWDTLSEKDKQKLREDGIDPDAVERAARK